MMEFDPFVSLWICEKRDVLFVLKTNKLYQKYVIDLYVSMLLYLYVFQYTYYYMIV